MAPACSATPGTLPLPQWPQPARDRRDTSLDGDGHTSEARGQGGMLPRSSPWLMDTFAYLGCLRHLVVTTLLSWVSFPQEGTKHLGSCPFRTLASGFVPYELPSTKADTHWVRASTLILSLSSPSFCSMLSGQQTSSEGPWRALRLEREHLGPRLKISLLLFTLCTTSGKLLGGCALVTLSIKCQS